MTGDGEVTSHPPTMRSIDRDVVRRPFTVLVPPAEGHRDEATLDLQIGPYPGDPSPWGSGPSDPRTAD